MENDQNILTMESMTEAKVLLMTEEATRSLLDSAASYHVTPFRSQFDEAGIRASFPSGGWRLHKGNLLLARGPKIHSLYPLYITLREGDFFLVDIPVSSLWHGRLGHLSKAGIKYLSKTRYIPKVSFSDHQFCEHCQYGKQVAASHPISTPRESISFDLVHSDICGPMPHQSLGGASYFVPFINDATRKLCAYPIQKKDCVFTIFKDWLTMVENQTDQKLKCLRSDNEGEYKCNEFIEFCQERGIRRVHPILSGEQHGVEEWMSQTIQERIVSMLRHSILTVSCDS
jgi:hypothetical protein